MNLSFCLLVLGVRKVPLYTSKKGLPDNISGFNRSNQKVTTPDICRAAIRWGIVKKRPNRPQDPRSNLHILRPNPSNLSTRMPTLSQLQRQQRLAHQVLYKRPPSRRVLQGVAQIPTPVVSGAVPVLFRGGNRAVYLHCRSWTGT